MRWGVRLAGVLGVFLLLVMTTAGEVQTQATSNVTVSLGVGDTNLRVKGRTAPNSLVTIELDDAVIGTVTSDVNGDYNVLFLAQIPGTHDLGVYAKDGLNRTTDTVNLSINLTAQAETEAYLFLPPVLQINNSVVTAGEAISLEGSTYPGSAILIVVNDAELVSTAAGSDGGWSVQLGTSSLGAGFYDIYVKAQSGIYTSYSSAKQTVQVSAAPATPTPAPTSSLVATPSPGTGSTPPSPTVAPSAPVIRAEPGQLVEIQVDPLPQSEVEYDTGAPIEDYHGHSTISSGRNILWWILASGLIALLPGLLWLAHKRHKDRYYDPDRPKRW